MKTSARIVTPFIGDYRISGHWAMTYQLDAGLHILNADKTMVKMDAILQRNAWQSNSATVTILIPEVCNLETSVFFIKNNNGVDTQFKFKNNKKVLHELGFNLRREQNDTSVAISASFSGYSYIILTSKWDVEIKHEGTINKHFSYIRVNNFILDHQFSYIDRGDWSFYLTGKSTFDLLNVTLLHEDGARIFYNLNVMDTEVISLQGDVDQGYANLNLLDNILQIHSKFTNEDELITYTKIITEFKVIAEVTTSSFLRFDDNNVLESMVIAGNLKSDDDSATLKINMDSGRQIIGSFNVNYDEHQASLEVDVLSMNNSVSLTYNIAKQHIVGLHSFLYFSAIGGSAGLVANYREHRFWINGDLNFDEDQTITLKATADSSFDVASFPMTLTGTLSIPNKRIYLLVLDRNKAGISVTGQLNLLPNTKTFMFKGDMPGYNDEFINLDIKYDTSIGQVLVFTYEKKRFRYYGEFSMTDDLIEAYLQTPLEGFKRVSFKLGYVNENPQRAVLEFTKEAYTFDSEILFIEGNDAQIIVLARSTDGLKVEAVFTKLRRMGSSDFKLVVDYNGTKMEAGALLKYAVGNLNITTNVSN
jgi:hypothetical protein